MPDTVHESPDDENKLPESKITTLPSEFFDERVEVEGIENFDSPYIEVVNKIYSGQDELLEALETHLIELPDSSTEDINEKLSVLVDYCCSLVDMLFPEDDTDLTLAVPEYSALISSLNSSLAKEMFLLVPDAQEVLQINTDRDEIEDMIWGIYDSTNSFEEFTGYLKQGFADGRHACLQSVLDVYVSEGHGIEKPETISTRKALLKKIATEIGKAAGSVVVIATGMAGGLIAAHKFVNRKQ